MRRHWLWIAFIVLLPAYVAAQTGAEKVTSAEGITEYRLQNGFRVLLFPDPSKPTVIVNITYLVGSRHEGYGETGMAHLLEHMLYKGSMNHPNVDKELQDHGTRANGSTWYDRTNYFETFQATDENLEWALSLEADRMVNSFVAKKDLDSEMTVVRNEFERGENSPLGILEERVLATAYLWHNYGKSTIGARSDIENVPIERLQAFYRNYYQPENAVLVVAGQIDETKTLGLVAKYFGSIPRPQRVLQTTYTAEPTQDGERTVTLKRVGEVQGVTVAYHVPAGSHADFAAVEIAAKVLGDSPSGRLYQTLVESKKAATIRADAYQLKEPGVAIFSAEVRKESAIGETRDALLATIDAVASKPFTSEEVERARAALLKDIDLLLNDSTRVGRQLTEWAAMGDWRLLFLHRDRLKQVTTADVQRAATYYLKPDNRTIGLFIPTAEPNRTEVPPPPDLTTLLRDYKGNPAVSVGEAFDAAPANIDSRTQRVNLPNGMKLVLVPKETRGDVVSAVMRLNFGNEQDLAGYGISGRLTAQMLMRGTTKHTRQQIQDELDKLKARLTIAGGAIGVTVTIETIQSNLAKVVELASEILREPAFPATEFETLRQAQIAAMESQKTEPDAIASLAYRRLVNPYPKGDVRYVLTFDEELAALRDSTVDQLRNFHTGFYGASNAELTVVGEFDSEDISKVANAQFGSWNSPKPYVQIKSPYQKIEPVSESFKTPDKANAYFLAGMRINVSDEDPDYAALVLSNYMLGQGFNSRLFQRIRNREGLSYSVFSSFSVAPTENNASFMAIAISAPQNTPKVEASFRDELANILRDGFTEAEVTAAKASWTQAQQVSRAQDRELADRLQLHTHFGRTMAWDAALQDRIQHLTPQQIRDALRRHINLPALTFMRAGDF
jgi:zinc protease